MQLREKLPPNAPDGYELIPGYIIDFKMGKLGSKTLKTTVEEKIEEVKKDGNLSKPLVETKIGEYSGFTYSRL